MSKLLNSRYRWHQPGTAHQNHQNHHTKLYHSHSINSAPLSQFIMTSQTFSVPISTWYLRNIYVISTRYIHDRNTDVDLTVAGHSCDVRSGGGGPHPLHQVISIISTLSTISSVSISTISAQHGHLLHVGAVRVAGPAAVQQTGRSALRDALTLTQESRW